MPEWNACLYLKFKKERTQPAIDLAGRIAVDHPQRIVDIGCGPGNSTAVLAQRFQGAYVLGIDSSQKMIEKAQADYPQLDFTVCDAAKGLDSMGSGFDIVFSNACLQWVPGHDKVLVQMMGLLEKDGVMAVQVPYNHKEPIKKIIFETAAAPQWKEYLDGVRPFHTRTVSDYYDILHGYAKVNIWETVYYHVLDSHEDILHWYRGTGLRPYLERLPDDKKTAFKNEILHRISKSYPRQKNGKVLFRFPRLFFTVRK